MYNIHIMYKKKNNDEVYSVQNEIILWRGPVLSVTVRRRPHQYLFQVADRLILPDKKFIPRQKYIFTCLYYLPMS